MTIGESIRTNRNRCGLTQQQLADKLFVTHELISKWENGSRIPDYRSIRAMAGILGITEDELTESGSRTIDELRPCLPEGMTSDALAEIINEFLETLTERDRNIFVMRYYFFEDTGTIAGRIGISGGSVRMQLTRIRSRLKSFIGRNNDEKQ